MVHGPGDAHGPLGGWWLASDGNWYPVVPSPPPPPPLTGREALRSFMSGFGVFFGIGGLWSLLFLGAHLTILRSSVPIGESDAAAITVDVLGLGMPLVWIVGLFVCRRIRGSRPAALGAYLLASTVVNVVAIVLIARSTEHSDLTIDQGGGAGLVILPMAGIAIGTLAAGIVLTAVGFSGRAQRR